MKKENKTACTHSRSQAFVEPFLIRSHANVD